MSNRKLIKFLERPVPQFQTPQLKTPVILTTSKGRYLKQELRESDVNIVWCIKSGASTAERVEYLRHNIKQLIKDYGTLYIYIWVGTCDVTYKAGKYIDIRFKDASLLLDHLKPLFQEFVDLCAKHTVDCVFLEIPQISIVEWNRSRHHPNPCAFKDNDVLVRNQINQINEIFHEFNNALGKRPPSLMIDLTHSRKQKEKAAKISYNFSLMLDGVHPSTLLARTWMRKILISIQRDCY